MAKIRVLLADDHGILRAGLRALINAEADMEVVGEAANGRRALEQARLLQPDVVVMDISMPVMNGLEATRLLRREMPDCQIIILTVHAEEEYLFQTLQAGGAGYVLKSAADTDLIEAIRKAYRGEVFLYPSSIKKLLSEYLRRLPASEQAGRVDRLTAREREVLKLTAEGYTNQEIAKKLVISPKTVDTYRQRIMEKLQLHHRPELVRYALRTGLLSTTD